METIQPLRLYTDYTSYLRTKFGQPVQKISVNTGSTCPNRDGSLGSGGCTYCNVNSIQPTYVKSTPGITEQLEKGIQFFSKRHKRQLFLAYFQSYTSTYGSEVALIAQIEEAITYPLIVGIVISTRPDCVSEELVKYLVMLNQKTYVSVEFGIESTDEETLKRINRCHTFDQAVESVNSLASEGIAVGGHLILGFPWESEDTMLMHAKRLSSIPLSFLKIHHLQILRYTMLAKEHARNAFTLLTPEKYLDLIIHFLELLPPGLVIQRFLAEAPEKLLVAPRWGGIRNAHFATLVERELENRNSYQGRLYQAG